MTSIYAVRPYIRSVQDALVGEEVKPLIEMVVYGSSTYNPKRIPFKRAVAALKAMEKFK